MVLYASPQIFNDRFEFMKFGIVEGRHALESITVFFGSFHNRFYFDCLIIFSATPIASSAKVSTQLLPTPYKQGLESH